MTLTKTLVVLSTLGLAAGLGVATSGAAHAEGRQCTTSDLTIGVGAFQSAGDGFGIAMSTASLSVTNKSGDVCTIDGVVSVRALDQGDRQIGDVSDTTPAARHQSITLVPGATVSAEITATVPTDVRTSSASRLEILLPSGQSTRVPVASLQGPDDVSWLILDAFS